MNKHGILIPRYLIPNKQIPPNAKLLFGEILYMMDNQGKCTLNLKEISNNYSKGVGSVQEWVKVLTQQNFISVEKGKDFSEILKNKNLHGMGIGNEKCSWCGISTVCLHEHHYPIPACKGGTETVGICPNCHQEFHTLENILFVTVIMSEDEIQWFKEEIRKYEEGENNEY